MQHVHRSFRFLLISVFLMPLGLISKAQAATFTFYSTTAATAKKSSSGYKVDITVLPVAIVAPAGCTGGYNYDVEYQYTISYSGVLPANSSLWNLAMTFNCGDNNFGIWDLPKTISPHTLTGTGTTSHNQWSGASDCNTATVVSKGCLSGNSTLTISGPDMPEQSRTMPTNPTPLPVTLVSFDARKTTDGISLAWTTTNEENGDRYFLEKSTDAAHWAVVTLVHSSNKGDYHYLDTHPATGMSYYRLRNVDAYGEVTYSRVIGVKVEAPQEAGMELTVFPNPLHSSGDRIRVAGISNPEGWNLTLTNTAGAVLSHQALNSLEVALPPMPAGLYFVRFTNRLTHQSNVVKLVRE